MARLAAATVLIVAALSLTAALPLAKVRRVHTDSKVEAAAVPADCGCSWTSSPGACGNDDGSECWYECCKGGPRPTAPVAPVSTSKCAQSGGRCGVPSACRSPSRLVSGLCTGGANNVCCLPGASPAPVAPTAPVSTGMDPTLTLSGTTTRYFDCCKPSCAWPSNTNGRGAVRTCDITGNYPVDPNANNVCGGGGGGGAAYVCNNQEPFEGSDGNLYGFVATQIGSCCDCFLLQFQTGPGRGKKMYVQRANTGGDLSSSQFDIMTAGGGWGIFNGCGQRAPNGPAMFPNVNWGAQYGGVSSCSGLPAGLQNGCNIRMKYFPSNPSVKYKQVACPATLTQISGCG